MNRGLLPGGLSSDAYFDKHLRPLDAEHYSAAGIVPYRRKQGDLELLLPLEKPWNSFTKGYDPIGWNVFCGKRVPRQERSAETTAVRCFLECVGHVDGCPDTEKLYGMTQGSHVLWYPSGKFALLLVEVPDEVMASFPEQFSQAFNQAGPNEEYRILPMGIKKYVKQIEALEWVPTSNLIPETKGEVSDLLNNILRVNGFRDFLCGQFVAPDSNEPMVDCAPPAENAPKYANEYGGKPEGKGKGGKGGGWGGKGGKGGSGKDKGGKDKGGWKGQQNKGMGMPFAFPGKGGAMGPMFSPYSDQNSAEMQRQMYGEQLYVLVQPLAPSAYLAQKITGMLLELPQEELMMNLTNQEELHRRVREALEVLKEDGIVG